MPTSLLSFPTPFHSFISLRSFSCRPTGLAVIHSFLQYATLKQAQYIQLIPNHSVLLTHEDLSGDTIQSQFERNRIYTVTTAQLSATKTRLSNRQLAWLPISYHYHDPRTHTHTHTHTRIQPCSSLATPIICKHVSHTDYLCSHHRGSSPCKEQEELHDRRWSCLARG